MSPDGHEFTGLLKPTELASIASQMSRPGFSLC